METTEKVVYEKRTQRDYSMSFKLQVVQEIERMELSVIGAKRKYGIQGRSTVLTWLRKYGKFDWENQTPSNKIYIYNEQRPHYSYLYLTPIQMHLQNRIKIKTYKNKYPSKNVFTGI